MPFLVSIALVAFGLFIRLRIMESPVFAQIKETRSEVKIPVVELFRGDLKNVLLAAGLYLAHGVIFYALTVYTVAYTTSRFGIAENRYLIGVSAAAALQIFLVPFFGRLSDHLGRRPVITFGTIFITVFAVPLYFMINSQVTVLAWLAVMIGIGIGHSAVYGPTAAFYTELFPARVRYSGASISYQLGGAIAGFVPLIATSMVGAAGGAFWPIPMLIAIAALIGLLCVTLATRAREEEPVAEPATSS